MPIAVVDQSSAILENISVHNTMKVDGPFADHISIHCAENVGLRTRMDMQIAIHPTE